MSDNDTAGVSVSPTSLSVNESGTTTYTVVLNTEPSGTVTAQTGDGLFQPQEDDDVNNETVAISHSVSGYAITTRPG